MLVAVLTMEVFLFFKLFSVEKDTLIRLSESEVIYETANAFPPWLCVKTIERLNLSRRKEACTNSKDVSIALEYATVTQKVSLQLAVAVRA